MFCVQLIVAELTDFYCWNLLLQAKSLCLTDQMNVCWHRPSQKSSAFMYITFRMSSNGTRRVCHLLAGPQWWSYHTCKHQGCNMIYAIFPHINVKKNLLSNSTSSRGMRSTGVSVSLPLWEKLCVWRNHSTQFVVIIIIIAQTEGQERGCVRQHPVLVRL